MHERSGHEGYLRRVFPLERTDGGDYLQQVRLQEARDDRSVVVH